jgi:hypothetical protein
MSDQDWQKWFESIWALREETLYGSFFGNLGKGIFPIPLQTFQQIGIPDPDPRFLFHGVFECPPSDRHPDYIYVTSGMSNAWGESPETANPNGFSGLGWEYTLHTSSSQHWAIQILHWFMALQLAIASGRRQGDLAQRHMRVGIGNPIPVENGTGQITKLLLAAPDEPGLDNTPITPLCYPNQFQLPTGKVDFLMLIGITEKERDFARSRGVQDLVTLLRRYQVFPRTDPIRSSLV